VAEPPSAQIHELRQLANTVELATLDGTRDFPDSDIGRPASDPRGHLGR
jgi:hypothetical protein